MSDIRTKPAPTRTEMIESMSAKRAMSEDLRKRYHTATEDLKPTFAELSFWDDPAVSNVMGTLNESAEPSEEAQATKQLMADAYRKDDAAMAAVLTACTALNDGKLDSAACHEQIAMAVATAIHPIVAQHVEGAVTDLVVACRARVKSECLDPGLRRFERAKQAGMAVIKHLEEVVTSQHEPRREEHEHKK